MAAIVPGVSPLKPCAETEMAGEPIPEIPDQIFPCLLAAIVNHVCPS